VAVKPRIILFGRLEVEPFEALAQGVRAVDWQPVLQRPSQFTASDALTTVQAVLTHGLNKEALPIAQFYRARGIPVWVLELPRIRQLGGEHAILYDSLHWLPNGVSGRPVPTLPKIDRKAGAKHILVAMQKPKDAAHGMDAAQVEQWARDTVAFARDVTGKAVMVRPHPKHGANVPDDAWGADRVSHPKSEPIDAALRESIGVVTWNSTTGWDAIIAGVPVVALAPASACAYHPYTTTLAELKPLPAKARTEALARAANTQWTLTELADGSAMRAMLATDPMRGIR
jgi:hypothetical protein